MKIWKPMWMSKLGKKFFGQKLTRGFSDFETWNLDYIIAKFSLPRVKRFKQLSNGFPGDCTEAEWNIIIDKIIYSLEASLKDFNGNLYADCFVLEDYEKINKKMDEGFVLFGKYFRDLWW